MRALPLSRFTGKVVHICVREIIVTYRSSRFATDEALKEIHRTLAPNAVLGMIWNVEECRHKPWLLVTSSSNTSHRQQA
jgi:hypothetical protein